MSALRDHVRTRSFRVPDEPIVMGYAAKQRPMLAARRCDRCGAWQSRYRVDEHETLCAPCQRLAHWEMRDEDDA